MLQPVDDGVNGKEEKVMDLNEQLKLLSNQCTLVKKQQVKAQIADQKSFVAALE